MSEKDTIHKVQPGDLDQLVAAHVQKALGARAPLSDLQRIAAAIRPLVCKAEGEKLCPARASCALAAECPMATGTCPLSALTSPAAGEPAAAKSAASPSPWRGDMADMPDIDPVLARRRAELAEQLRACPTGDVNERRLRADLGKLDNAIKSTK